MKRLKELRNEFGYNVREVATLINSDRTTISKYENDGRKLTAQILIAFSSLYQVTADYIIENSNLGIYVVDSNGSKLLLTLEDFKTYQSQDLIEYKSGIRYLKK